MMEPFAKAERKNGLKDSDDRKDRFPFKKKNHKDHQRPNRPKQEQRPDGFDVLHERRKNDREKNNNAAQEEREHQEIEDPFNDNGAQDGSGFQSFRTSETV